MHLKPFRQPTSYIRLIENPVRWLKRLNGTRNPRAPLFSFSPLYLCRSPTSTQDDASGLYDMDGEDEVWLKLYNERVCR